MAGTPQTQSEVRERALELLEREQPAGQVPLRRDAFGLAIPERVMQQATHELWQEKLAKRQRRTGIIKTLLFAVLGLAIVALAYRAYVGPTAWSPWREDFEGGSASWSLQANSGTVADVEFRKEGKRGRYAQVTVKSFYPPRDGRYYVNLRAKSPPVTLRGYETVSLRLRGRGLEHVRIYARDGSRRWRSPPIAVGKKWRKHRVDLSDFEYQEGRKGDWKAKRFEPPGVIERLQIKLGYYVNPPEASGQVDLDDLRFQ